VHHGEKVRAGDTTATRLTETISMEMAAGAIAAAVSRRIMGAAFEGGRV
jgi:hypothetical protein